MKNLTLKKRNQINIVFGLLLVVFLVLFLFLDKLIFKTLTSLCFLCPAIILIDPTSKKDKRYPFFLILGLFCCLLGDVSIFFMFELGALFFAIGHIFYSIAHFSICKFMKREILFTIAFFIVAYIMLTFTPFVYVGSKLLPVCFGYSLIISFMVSKTVSNFIEKKDRLTFLVCIGSLIFVISDMMVFFNTFNTGSGLVYKNIGHILYFPAQYIIAQSIKHYYN